MGFPQLSLERVIPTIAAPKVPLILFGAAPVEDSGSNVPHEPSLTVCIQNMVSLPIFTFCQIQYWQTQVMQCYRRLNGTQGKSRTVRAQCHFACQARAASNTYWAESHERPWSANGTCIANRRPLEGHPAWEYLPLTLSPSLGGLNMFPLGAKDKGWESREQISQANRARRKPNKTRL